MLPRGHKANDSHINESYMRRTPRGSESVIIAVNLPCFRQQHPGAILGFIRLFYPNVLSMRYIGSAEQVPSTRRRNAPSSDV